MLKINVTFNKTMDKSETQKAFTILPNINGSFNWISNKMIFSPDVSLAYNTTYKVMISKDAKDTNGFSLENDLKWSFKTIKKENIRKNHSKPLKRKTI